jgi:3-oxoacyl-[acyl-carrier protein] reductase
MTAEQWDAILDVHLKAPFRILRAAQPVIIGLTRTLAKEWGRHKVNVNAVAFGFIETRLTTASADGSATIDIEGRQIKVGVNPALLEMAKLSIPPGRPGTPDEAAGSVVMLTYPEADYVSGQVLVTSGGFEA